MQENIATNFINIFFSDECHTDGALIDIDEMCEIKTVTKKNQ